MHALVPAVLLRVAGLDALDADPQPQPPHRELAQTEEGTGARERMAVVGADGQRQAEVLKSPLKHGKGVHLLGGREGVAAQKITAGKVGDRERIAVASIGEHELALVIRAPQIVGLRGLREPRALGLVAASTTSCDETVP